MSKAITKILIIICLFNLTLCFIGITKGEKKEINIDTGRCQVVSTAYGNFVGCGGDNND